jgi:excisionase family DNA binding protein
VAEVADLLAVTERTVLRWLDRGQLEGFRSPGGAWRIPGTAVERLRRGGQ